MKIENKNEKLVNIISLSLVLSVFIIKLIISFFTTFFSFYIELLDSILDFISVLITFIALKISKRPADNDHMYGHYKVNSMAGFIQSLLIVGLYSNILYDSIKIIFSDKNYHPENGLIAIISLSAILILVFFASRKIVSIGKITKNQAIIGQGLNFQADFYRNISVIIGLIISNFGIYIFDLIIAIIFSLISIYKGFKVLKHSFSELIDANFLTDDKIEDIKNNIKMIKCVDQIDDFAIKTAGINLDANISIRIDAQFSVSFTNLISKQIRDIFKVKCPEYDSNVLISFNSGDNIRNISFFEQIREIINKGKSQYNIHNIIIDNFEDALLIQYHIKVPPAMDLLTAHRIATKSEKEIQARLRKIQKFNDIKVISHIEPAERKEKQHFHPFETHVRKDIKVIIENLIKEFDEIKALKRIQILQEEKVFSLIVFIKISPTITLRKAHEIAEFLELKLHYAFNNLDHCLIHTDPTNV